MKRNVPKFLSINDNLLPQPKRKFCKIVQQKRGTHECFVDKIAEITEIEKAEN